MQTSSPWDSAEQHCLDTIKNSTEMVELIRALKTLPATFAMPLISSMKPTLVLMPENADNKDAVKSFTETVENLTGSFKPITIRSGDYWKVVIQTKVITIDITTNIPHAKPDVFEL